MSGDTSLIRSRADLWFYSVGRHIRDTGATDDVFYRAYLAADVGTYQPKSVMQRLRALPKLPGRIKVSTFFTATPTPSVSRDRRFAGVPHHVVKAVQRQYRREFEEHLDNVMVLVGAQFSSMNKFMLANRMLAYGPRAVDGSASRVRRVRTGAGQSMPMFHGVDRFYYRLIEWAIARISMGSVIRQTSTVH